MDSHWFKILAGVFLVLSGILLSTRSWFKPSEKIRSPNLTLSLICGAIGLVSGLLGVGGRIFLSSLIIMLGYTTMRNASGVAALFILFNSILVLAGHYASLGHISGEIIYWIMAVS
jgi:hypothetical protein